MMEMVVLGLTIVIGMIGAYVLMFYGTLKLMTNKKFMIKLTKKYIKVIEDVTNELTEDLFKDEADE